MVVPHIVNHHDDLRMFPVGVQHLFQVLFKAFVVALLMKGDRYLSGTDVIAAHCGLLFPPPLFGHDPRLVANLAPLIVHSGGI